MIMLHGGKLQVHKPCVWIQVPAKTNSVHALTRKHMPYRLLVQPGDLGKLRLLLQVHNRAHRVQSVCADEGRRVQGCTTLYTCIVYV